MLSIDEMPENARKISFLIVLQLIADKKDPFCNVPLQRKISHVQTSCYWYIF